MTTKERNNAFERYKDYDPKIQEYMQSLIDNLASSDEHFPASLFVTLDLVADQLEIYYRANAELRKSDLMVQHEGGRISKSPLFAIANGCLVQIHNLLKSLAATVISADKKESLNKHATAAFDTNAYIEDLIS